MDLAAILRAHGTENASVVDRITAANHDVLGTDPPAQRAGAKPPETSAQPPPVPPPPLRTSQQIPRFRSFMDPGVNELGGPSPQARQALQALLGAAKIAQIGELQNNLWTPGKLERELRKHKR